MAQLRIRLFGQFRASTRGDAVENWGSSKAEELFCYLLLNRDRPHARELLASTLWDHATTSQSKAYLRKTLWQLQSVLRSELEGSEDEVLHVSPEWIRYNPDFNLWLDVRAFEDAYQCTEGIPGEELSDGQARQLREAVDIYEGDLLENWFQEWCLYERERFRHLHFSMLDKLIAFYEARRKYDSAMAFAERILQQDRAREYTHRQLMRLRHLLGDRTGAMRQYSSCARALRDELDIAPSQATRRLYEQIRADEAHSASGAAPKSISTPYEMLHELKTAVNLLAEAQERMRREIAMLEESLQRVGR